MNQWPRHSEVFLPLIGRVGKNKFDFMLIVSLIKPASSRICFQMLTSNSIWTGFERSHQIGVRSSWVALMNEISSLSSDFSAKSVSFALNGAQVPRKLNQSLKHFNKFDSSSITTSLNRSHLDKRADVLDLSCVISICLAIRLEKTESTRAVNFYDYDSNMQKLVLVGSFDVICCDSRVESNPSQHATLFTLSFDLMTQR
jgi:hypothetical protein